MAHVALVIVATVALFALGIAIRNAVWVNRMRASGYDYNPPPWLEQRARAIPPPLPGRLELIASRLEALLDGGSPVGDAELIPDLDTTPQQKETTPCNS